MIPRFGGVRLSGESSWSVVPPMDPEIQRFGGLGLTVEWSESVMPPLLMDEPKEKRKMFATFSKGYPVFEWELWGYFNRMFGGCLATVWSPSLCRQACVDAKVYPESLRTTLIFPVVFPVADPEIKLSGEEEAKSRVEEKLQKPEAGGGQADARWRRRSVMDCRVAMARCREGNGLVADEFWIPRFEKRDIRASPARFHQPRIPVTANSAQIPRTQIHGEIAEENQSYHYSLGGIWKMS
nr:Rho guanine nucleotide exchange factor [Ipomoea batatas]